MSRFTNAKERNEPLIATSRMIHTAIFQMMTTEEICNSLELFKVDIGQRDENHLLSGIVELDDGYIGGNSHNGKRGSETGNPIIAVALSQTTNSAALYALMKGVGNVQRKTFQQIVDQYLVPDIKVEYNGYSNYLNMECVRLEPKKYGVGDLNWMHKAIGNLKTFLLWCAELSR